ncbi:MAG: type VI secretion system tip protein VgrG, partial [Comamonadaceae bacterium]
PAPAPASNRRFTFETTARDDKEPRAFAFDVVQMRGEEGISRPFRFELLLSSNQPRVDLDAVLKADASFTIYPPKASDTPAAYHGCLAEFDQLQQVNDQLYLYRAVLVPHLWRLSQYRHSNVFLDTAVDDIVTDLLKRLGSLTDQSTQSEGLELPPGFRNKLLRTGDKTYYGPREYVCQYQETPLDFLSRWMEKEGIYYYFEHDKRKSELLVLLDDKIAQDDQAYPAQYQSVGHRGADQSPNSVQGFICRTRPVIEGVEHREFDARAADKAPQREEYTSTSKSLSDQSWPGARVGIDMHFGDNARPEIAPTTPPVGLAHEGRRYAQVRAQERFAQARVFYGEATAVGLRSGKLMSLTGHFREPDGGTYLVTEITHEGS